MASALVIFGILAMAECLPRDGSLKMIACDIEKQREFWLYPLIVFGAIILAACAEIRGKTWGKTLSAASGVIALIILLMIGFGMR